MFLRSIRVQDFRNLQGAIDWGKGTNVIYGNNGQGKTNWLEAVHFLAHAKSFRTRHPHEGITFGKTAALIRGCVATSGAIERELEVIIPAAEFAKMAKGTAYTLHPVNGKKGYEWKVPEGVTLTRQ